MARLWFATFRPFEDGDGRIGRAMAQKALAQTLEVPTLTASATTINRHKRPQLHRASQSNYHDVWMGWFADIVRDAQTCTIESIRFQFEKSRPLNRLRNRINARQEKALIRMIAAGLDGFVGGLSAHDYRAITNAAWATATRDLADLVGLVR
jgi:Fic family protein